VSRVSSGMGCNIIASRDGVEVKALRSNSKSSLGETVGLFVIY